MASITSVRSLTGFNMVNSKPKNLRFLFAAATRPMQRKAEKEVRETHKNIRDAAEEVKKTAQDVREKVNQASDQVVEKTIEAAGSVVHAVENHGGNVKQTVKNAWGSTKDTVQKVKDAVVGKAGETMESIKDGADNVKRSMNKN